MSKQASIHPETAKSLKFVKENLATITAKLEGFTSTKYGDK